MHARRSHSGFTLLELLVALAIVMVVVASLGASLSAAFKARRSATAGLGSVRTARLALASAARDLRAALPPVGILAGAFTGTDDRISNMDHDSVTFFNTADPTRIVAGAADVEEVTLTVVSASEIQFDDISADAQSVSVQHALLPVPSGAEDGVLVRRVRRQLLAATVQTPVDQVLCRGVRGMNLRYFDGSEWLDTWDSSTVDNMIPTAIELTLTIADDAGRDYQVISIIRPACGRPSSVNAQSASTGGATP